MIGLSTFLSAEFTRANEIVTDNTTKLQWQDDALGDKTTWQSAIDRCEALSLGGFEDWRLPNINELSSLINYGLNSPSIAVIFQNTASGPYSHYWSSTTNYANNSDYAWYVYFDSGAMGSHTKNGNDYVRCVRAGE